MIPSWSRSIPAALSNPFGLSAAGSELNYGPSWQQNDFLDCQPSWPPRQRQMPIAPTSLRMRAAHRVSEAKVRGDAAILIRRPGKSADLAELAVQLDPAVTVILTAEDLAIMAARENAIGISPMRRERPDRRIRLDR